MSWGVLGWGVLLSWGVLHDSPNREPVSYVLFNTRFQTWLPKIYTAYHK